MSIPAAYLGTEKIYWSAIIIALGALCALVFGLGMSKKDSGGLSAMSALFLTGTISGLYCARALHWYCHSEQYASLGEALKNLDRGGFCIVGVFAAFLVCALILRLVRLTPSYGALLDAFAPGACVGLIFIRLSSLFDSTCRSKIVIENPLYMSLPIGSYSSSTGDWRFASFFAEAIVLIPIFILTLTILLRRRGALGKNGKVRTGDAVRIFLAFYAGMEIVIDSTRYDSSFLPANGFVSATQIFCAVMLAAIFVYYIVCSVKANKFKLWHIALIVLFLGGLGLAGANEYLVQRHGDEYLKCYKNQSLGVIVSALMTYISYRTILAGKADALQMFRDRKKAEEAGE
ncbi:MAG: prolipoprotein diacylglyceryl transferase [Oscillospiraceae bacterium]|nr:prolipoprotein diacylglyceryl transferase [Oscillospiraceae bacterium]